jgi:hypothetical protein
MPPRRATTPPPADKLAQMKAQADGAWRAARANADTLEAILMDRSGRIRSTRCVVSRRRRPPRRTGGPRSGLRSQTTCRDGRTRCAASRARPSAARAPAGVRRGRDHLLRHVSANFALASSRVAANPWPGFTIAAVMLHIHGRSSGIPARGLKMRPMSRPRASITSQSSGP